MALINTYSTFRAIVKFIAGHGALPIYPQSTFLWGDMKSLAYETPLDKKKIYWRVLWPKYNQNSYLGKSIIKYAEKVIISVICRVLLV